MLGRILHLKPSWWLARESRIPWHQVVIQLGGILRTCSTLICRLCPAACPQFSGFFCRETALLSPANWLLLLSWMCQCHSFYVCPTSTWTDCYGKLVHAHVAYTHLCVEELFCFTLLFSLGFILISATATRYHVPWKCNLQMLKLFGVEILTLIIWIYIMYPKPLFKWK